MPDPDNDNPTPDFDDLIAQARRLREEGKDDEAIAKYEEARKIDGTHPELCELMELYIKTKRFSSAIDLSTDLYYGTLARHLDSDIFDLAEAAKMLQIIFALLIRINPSETIDSPGRPLWFLSLCATFLDRKDPDHLYGLSNTAENSKKIATGLYGWSEFHAECYLKYCSASEENLEETLATLREWAQENPAAWFYVGELTQSKMSWFDEVIEAYEQVPEGDPNYVQAMLQAAYYRECWADSEELLGESAFAAEMRSLAEERYANALEETPLNKEVRLGYLRRRIEKLLEEAAENGFERDRIDQASEFVGEIYRVLSGSDNEPEQDVAVGGAEARSLPLPHPELYDRYIAEHSQLLRNEIERTRREILTEIRAGRESVQEEFANLQEQLEANIASSAEMIRKYVIEQLQLSDEQLVDCERELRRDHSEFWENLDPASVRYLSTGCYILDVLGRNARRMEYSCAAIEFAKALETELRQHLVDPFISFAMQQGRGPNIFEKERSKITVGDICYVLETSGMKSEFAESLGEKGRFLPTDFPILKKINKLRGEAAHCGDIGRKQATELRDLILKILPKIVALRSR